MTLSALAFFAVTFRWSSGGVWLAGAVPSAVPVESASTAIDDPEELVHGGCLQSESYSQN
jgi:hypothetical protein